MASLYVKFQFLHTRKVCSLNFLTAAFSLFKKSLIILYSWLSTTRSDPASFTQLKNFCRYNGREEIEQLNTSQQARRNESHIKGGLKQGASRARKSGSLRARPSREKFS